MKNFLGKRILIITAHPDDESFLAAGSIFANAKAGGKNFLICATYGEKGIAHLKKPISTIKLKARRKQELARAAKFLRVSVWKILALPDGNVRNHQGKFFKRALTLARTIKPEAILGFGADGITAHWDHIAAGLVAKKIAKAIRVPYFAFALSPKFRKNSISLMKQKRFSPYYKDGAVFAKPNLKIKVDAAIKLRAVSFHTSQFSGSVPFANLPKKLQRENLENEYFVV